MSSIVDTNNPYYDIIIVGAGAAGLTAGYDILNYNNNNGVNDDFAPLTFKILEANPTRIGGRLKKSPKSFSDIPIDLGGEWIHVKSPDILNEIINIEGVTYDGETYPYRPENYVEYWNDDGEDWWCDEKLGRSDSRFYDSTWFDFFNDYIATDLLADDNSGNLIELGCQVTTIDSSGNDSGSNEESRVDVVCGDDEQLLRVAYHLGNRHVALQVGDGWVRIASDDVLAQMVEGLGASVRQISAPFSPEGGAYGDVHHSHHHHD